MGYAAGSEFRVNTYTTSYQHNSRVTGFSDGGFVVTWQSSGQDGSNYGVYGQLYAADGSAVGTEFQVNNYTTYSQLDPSVSALPGGGFVVVWASNGQDGFNDGVYGQRYDAGGATVGSEFRVNTYTAEHQSRPSVATLLGGGFVVAWNSLIQDGAGNGVYGQLYATDGTAVGAEFRVNSHTTGNQSVASITALSAGGFVVTWTSSLHDGYGYGIYGQRYASDGTAVGAEFQINSYTTGDQSLSTVSALSDGGFVVTWQSDGQDGSGYGIYGQRYASDGTAVSTEFQINSYTTNNQGWPTVCTLSGGDFVVTWRSYDQDGSDYEVYAQLYSADATAVGTEFRVNSYTTSAQSTPTVSALSGGGFVVTWTSLGQDGSSDGIYAKVYTDVTAPNAPTGLDLAAADDTGSSASDDITKNTTALTISGSGETGATVTLFDDANANGAVDAGESLGTAAVVAGAFSLDVALAAGTHSVKVLQTDPAGNSSAVSTALGITVDTTAPTAPTGLDLAAADDTGASDSDNITGNSTALTISGSGETGATVTVFDDANANGAVDAGENLGTAAVVAGAFSIDVALTAGTHSLKAIQADLAGNSSGTSAALSITVDTTAPTAPTGLDLAAADDTGSSTSDDITKNTTALTVSGTGENSATVTVFDDANSNGAVDAGESLGTAMVASGAFTIDAALAAGTHSIKALQTDTAGNTSTASTTLSITVDTTGPSTAASTRSTDVNGSGTYTSGDKIFLTFSEAVDTSLVTLGNLNLSGGHSFGTGATIQASDASGGCATTFVVTLGTGATVYQSDTVSIAAANLVDKAGNQPSAAATATVSAPGAMGYAAGSEFRVNTYTTNGQIDPSVTALEGGGFVVTWTSDGPDGSNYGIYGQLYDAIGAAVGSEFRINTYTTDAQQQPSVTALGGGFVVTWTSNGQDGSGLGTYGQLFDSSGAAVGSEFRVNTYTTSDQQYPSVTALTGGGFVATWRSSWGQDGSAYGVYGQLYDFGGNAVGSEFLVNTYTTESQTRPSVTALSAGGFVVTWCSWLQDGSGNGVYGQRYDASGAAVGSEFRINTYTTSHQEYPCVAALSGGGFVATWTSVQDNGTYGIYGQRYDANGAAVGGEFLVNNSFWGAEDRPSVISLSSGGFVVTWTSFGQSGEVTSDGVYGKLYDASGAAVGSEFRINTYTTDTQKESSVTALLSGGFVVTWSSEGQDGSDYGIYAKIYTYDVTAPNAPTSLDLAMADDTGASSSDDITKNTTGLTFSGSGETGATLTLFADANANGAVDAGESLGTVTVAAGAFTLDAALAAGTHSVRAIQTDAAGNTSSVSAALSITVDTSAAAPTGLDLAAADDTGSSSSDDVTKNTTALTISGSGETGATVTVFDDANANGAVDAGESLGTATVVAGAFTVDAALVAGPHSVKAIQTDTAGNASAASSALSIAVDTTAAAPTGLDLAAADDTGASDSDNITGNTTALTISGSGETGATVTVFDDANANGTVDAGESLGTTTAASGAFTVNVALAAGTHSVKAILTDVAGNTSASSAALAITVSSPAPTFEPTSDPTPTPATTTTTTEPRTLTATDGSHEARLNGGGETVRVSGFERLTGGTGEDVVIIADDRGVITVSGVESLTASGTANWIILGDGGNWIAVTGAETLVGGNGVDVVVLGGGRVILAAIESLTGSPEGDWVDLGNRGNTITVSGVETLVGGSNNDVVTLGDVGSTVILASVETLHGGSGGDWLYLGNRGNTMTVTGVETLVGGYNNDVVTLENTGSTVILAAIETLVGGAGGDWVYLGNRGNTMTLSGVETVVGGSNNDVVTLGNAGSTVILAAVETLYGGSGGDWIYLGNRGNTMTLSGVETLVGGSNVDVVTLGNAGSTVILAAIETLHGGVGSDIAILGNRGCSLAVTNVDTITGGMRADTVTVLTGATTFAGGGGDDSIALAANRARDTVILASDLDGTDSIAGFESGLDRILLQGGLRGLAISQLGADINSLTDSGFVAFRSALGTLSRPGGSVLVLASAGGDSGLYCVNDSNGDADAGVGEVRLLALSRGTVLALSDLS